MLDNQVATGASSLAGLSQQLNQTAETPRPVTQFYSELAIVISELHADITILEGRLAPIRCERAAVGGNSEGGPEPNRSEFAGNLIREINEVRKLRGRIQMLIDEIEI